MTRLPLFAALGPAALVVSATSVEAQDDPRLVTREYDATKIVRIEGRPGVQATIVFGEDEKIENVAVGDSEKWQITPNKRANLLFARPLDAAAVTNMTVVTDKRTYLFDLVATTKDKPVYLFRFTYGDGAGAQISRESPSVAAAPTLAEAGQPVPLGDPVRAAASPVVPAMPEPTATSTAVASGPQIDEAGPERSVVDEAIAANSANAGPSGAPAEVEAEQRAQAKTERRSRRASRGESSADVAADASQPEPVIAASEFVPAARPVAVEAPGFLNFAWSGEGKSALLPKRVYDDGMATYLIWGKNQKVPDVTVTDAQGVETTPRLTSENNSISLSGVPPIIVLRSGKSSATLENLRPVRISTIPAGQLSAQAGTSTAAGTN